MDWDDVTCVFCNIGTTYETAFQKDAKKISSLELFVHHQGNWEVDLVRDDKVTEVLIALIHRHTFRWFNFNIAREDDRGTCEFNHAAVNVGEIMSESSERINQINPMCHAKVVTVPSEYAIFSGDKMSADISEVAV